MKVKSGVKAGGVLNDQVQLSGNRHSFGRRFDREASASRLAEASQLN